MADMLKGPIDLSEVQDFSMAKKSNMNTPSAAAAAIGGKGKLDDMLSKLMKKNNCVSNRNCGFFVDKENLLYKIHRQNRFHLNSRLLLRSLLPVVRRNAAVNLMK